MTNDQIIHFVLWMMSVLIVFIVWDRVAEYRAARQRRKHRRRPTWELYAPYDEDENWSAEQDERRVH